MVQCAKPEWVSHENGQPIFSIDVHPDGTRFATAGNDNKAKIWNLQPCLDEAAENNPAVVRTLATLSGHEGSVNCVRWSPDGRYLASGSDDQLVMLWRLAAPGERLGAMPYVSSMGPKGTVKEPELSAEALDAFWEWLYSTTAAPNMSSNLPVRMFSAIFK